jgi:MYXO-CTERM domain-containing protein
MRAIRLSNVCLNRTRGLLLAGALTATSAAHADDWTSFGAAGGRSIGERSGAGFEPSWRHETPEERQTLYRSMLASPAVADGVIVVGNYADRLHGVDAVSGRSLWSATIPGPHHASPATWRGWAFVPSVDMTLRAVRLLDGSQVWQKPLPGMGFASPVVVEDRLYMATAEPAARLLCLTAETGEKVWEVGAEKLQQGAHPAVVVSGEHVLVAEGRGRLHSFARSDGHWEWTAPVTGGVEVAAPTVVGGRVYIATGGEEARLFAFALDTGAAVTGFPVALAPPEPTAGAGTFLGRDLVLSSLAGLDATDGAPGHLVLAFRLDERFDNNADAAADRFVSRERLLGLDPATGAIAWTKELGQLDTTDGGRVPMHLMTATPAIYRDAAGAVAVAAASSLQAQLRVLDATTGKELWAAELAGATRSSPVLANGRLIVATDAGTVHAFLSTANQPPVAAVMGFSPASGTEVDAGAVSIAWGTAADPEMGAVEYEVRVDDDGEILHDWQVATRTGAGQLALGALPTGSYTFAVRARDPHGAMSAWSTPVTFQAYVAPPVTLDGQPVAGLAAALAAAQPGAIIGLGAGTYVLKAPVQVPAGVTLQGAGPHLTVLSGRGLEVAVKPGAGVSVKMLTVANAAAGLQVGSAEVRLANVILRDNTRVGLEVLATGSAILANGTLTRNGAGVHALGTTTVRNALATANGVGLSAEAGIVLQSRFNNVYGNTVADYQGRTADSSDLAAAVTFEPGDATDDFQHEPAPNGGRINIGAFGNTEFAELSALGGDIGGDGSDGGVSPDGGAPGVDMKDPAGCGCEVGGTGGGAGGALGLGLALAAVVLRLRRRFR